MGHPHFLTADFALVRDSSGSLTPRLVEIQAFPSVYGYQAVLGAGYQQIFGLDSGLGMFLGGLSEDEYWDLLRRTILGNHSPENVVLTEVDPMHQKTRPDFEVTAQRLGISVVDIITLEPVGNKLHYRNAEWHPGSDPPHLQSRDRRRTHRPQHPVAVRFNARMGSGVGRPSELVFPDQQVFTSVAQPAAAQQSGCSTRRLLARFPRGTGQEQYSKRPEYSLPRQAGSGTVYPDLLLKPLFSFAGKGIQFDPTQAQLESIPAHARGEFLLQQRMNFVPTIETPHGLTQAEIRILYLWPDDGTLTPALSLVRLGRGKMMGVDHNRNQEWVGGSAAFFPR